MKNLARFFLYLILGLHLAYAQEMIFPGGALKGDEDRKESELIRAMQQYYREVHSPDSLGREHISADEAKKIALDAIQKHPNQVNDVLFTCGEYESPLLLAMCCDDKELVKALLDAGAIPCAFRASDENILSYVKRHVKEELGHELCREISDMVYIAQCKTFLIDACIKNRQEQ